MAEQKEVNTTLRAIFALVLGIILAFFVLGSFILFPATVDSMLKTILFLVLPVVSYLLSLAINTLNQYISCGSVSLAPVAIASSLTPGVVLAISLLTYFVTFPRAIVEAALPATADLNMKKAFGFAFYTLWAGIYSQTISSGLIQACPGAAGPK
jgi:hypothetical protein